LHPRGTRVATVAVPVLSLRPGPQTGESEAGAAPGHEIRTKVML
jgi:hypothetical protein